MESIKTSHAWLVLIILALIAWIFYSGKQAGKREQRILQENAILKEEIRQLRADSDTAQAKIEQVQQEREIYIKTATASQNDFKAEIRRLRKKITTSPTEPELNDSATATACDCATYDTLLQTQDSLIYSLETQVVKITDSFTAELALKDQQLASEKAISDLLTKNLEKDVKTLHKEKRKKKLFRSLSVVLGAVAAVLFVGSQ